VKEKPDRRSRAGKDYPWSVYETFELGLERVLAGQPELGVPPQPRAEELMGIMAHLAPDGIPLELFPESLFSRDELSGLIAALNEAALLTRMRLPEGAPAVNVHRLVQRVMQVRLAAKASASASAAAAVTLVADAFPYDSDDVRFWPRCRHLEPHAVAALAHAPDEGDAAEKTAYLLSQYALHLRARANYAEAEPLCRRALHVLEVMLGPEHPDVASGLNNLAMLLQDINRLAEAEPLIRQALAISEKALGPDHPTVAARLNNLAWLLRDRDRLDDAEPLMRRALAIWEATLDKNHPNVASALNNLALLLQATNRLAEAELLMCRALPIDEQSVGPDHPTVAIRLNNLALLLQVTNRLAEGEPLMRRALDIWMASLGPDHPNTKTVAKNYRILLGEIEAVKP
jgi:tetratricopeptide (TPR) repeat protein